MCLSYCTSFFILFSFIKDINIFLIKILNIFASILAREHIWINQSLKLQPYSIKAGGQENS